MACLDVDSLFTNVPLDGTIKIYVNELCKSSQAVSGLNKQKVLEMVSLTTKENIILFDQKTYSQIDGVAKGLSRNYIAKNCPKAFKPVYYKTYVDDIFVLFKKPEQVLRFVNYMHKRHKNIKFLFETEKYNSFPFLDIKICKEKDKFTIIVFRKVVYTLILVVLQHLNTNLAYCTHFYIDVSRLCLIFPNFALKLKHL